jgi:hypothetical protein
VERGRQEAGQEEKEKEKVKVKEKKKERKDEDDEATAPLSSGPTHNPGEKKLNPQNQPEIGCSCF